MESDFEYAHSQLQYDPESGLLFWKTGDKGRRVGQPAGGLDGKGYIRVRLKELGSHKFLAHRVIWLMTTGQWPSGFLDHKNGDRADNRLVNLREATRAQNSQNSKISRTNTSGVRGVYFDKSKNKWHAKIRTKEGRKFLGLFSDLKKAQKARKAAERVHFGEFVPTRKGA